MGKLLLKFVVLASIVFAFVVLFGSAKNGTFGRQANAQAIPTIDPSTYDANGNIPGKPGYDAVWTPGVGWQYIPVGGSTTGGTTSNGGFSPGIDKLPAGWTWTQNSTPCGGETYCYVYATGHYQHGVPPTGNTGTADGNSGGANYDPCLASTNKPNGCSCTTAQATACASGYCKTATQGATSGTCQTNPGTNGGIAGGDWNNPNNPYCPPGTGYYDQWGRLIPTCAPTITITTTPTCDPSENGGHIDQDDFNVWKQEFLHNISTTRSACMSPNKTVDLLGFQAWKNIAILHTKTNFNQ